MGQPYTQIGELQRLFPDVAAALDLALPNVERDREKERVCAAILGDLSEEVATAVPAARAAAAILEALR
jgi:hypothetical protein